MKIFYSLLLSTTFSIALQAQDSLFSLTFEDTTVINRVFYTDSTLDPQGIWQIGAPHKSFMNLALSPTNAVVTLLDSLLPPGSRGSFIIALPGTVLPWGGVALTFAHRFQFDPGKGGGYVEFSIDSGRIWHSIYDTGIFSYNPACVGGRAELVDNQMISPPTWYGGSIKDTLPSGNLFFGVTDSAWVFDTIVFPVTIFALKTNQLTPFIFRFTVFTDSSSSPSAGWEIDNINFIAFGGNCGGGINEINSSHLHVYPDPATDAYTISIQNEPESDYEVTLYDLSGRPVMKHSFTGQEITLRRDNLDGGTYFIQVTDRGSQNTFQKRIIFD